MCLKCEVAITQANQCIVDASYGIENENIINNLSKVKVLAEASFMEIRKNVDKMASSTVLDEVQRNKLKDVLCL